MVKSNSKNSLIIMSTAVLISVIFTPVNFDALIIPKIAVLFCMALYFLPQTLRTYHKVSNSNGKFFFYNTFIFDNFSIYYNDNSK